MSGCRRAIPHKTCLGAPGAAAANRNAAVQRPACPLCCRTRQPGLVRCCPGVYLKKRPFRPIPVKGGAHRAALLGGPAALRPYTCRFGAGFPAFCFFRAHLNSFYCSGFALFCKAGRQNFTNSFPKKPARRGLSSEDNPALQAQTPRPAGAAFRPRCNFPLFAPQNPSIFVCFCRTV